MEINIFKNSNTYLTNVSIYIQTHTHYMHIYICDIYIYYIHYIYNIHMRKSLTGSTAMLLYIYIYMLDHIGEFTAFGISTCGNFT